MRSFSLRYTGDNILFPALEQSMMAVVLINEKDEVLFFNRSAEKLWGYQRQEVLGKDVSGLVPSYLKGIHSGFISHNREGGEARVEGMSRELLLERKDGSTVWTRFSLSKVNVGGRLHYLALVRDASIDMERQEQQRLLILAVDHVDRPVIVLDTGRRIVQMNRAFTDMFGYSMKEAASHTLDSLLRLDESSPADNRERFHRLIWQDSHDYDEILLSGKNNQQIWIKASTSPVYGADKQLQNIVMTFSDITEDLRLRELEKDTLAAMSGHQSFQETGEIICHHIENILPGTEVSLQYLHSGVMSPWAASAAIEPAAENVAERSMSIRRRDGMTTGLLTFRSHGGKETLDFIDRVADISIHLCALAIEQEYNRLQIEQLVQFDSLTGLPNRNYLNQHIDSIFDDREEHRPAVFAVSVDNIRDVIDAAGYSATEQVVIYMANRLLALIGTEAFLSRTEGTQFVIVYTDMEISNITWLAEKLKTIVAEPVVINDHAFHLSLSIGISHEQTRDRDYLISTALSAMDSRSDAGGNDWRFFNAEMNKVIRERVLMGAALKNAIADGTLRLVYQPQIFAVTGELYGVEALARWRDPNFGDVPPDRFIALAEENGEIENIGNWVLREACRQLGQWREMGIDVPTVSVNLSALQLRNRHLVDVIREALETWSVPGDKLTIEITETGMMELDKEMLLQIHELRKMGVGLSIDDFGTGFSGLSRLASLPVSEIKIDKSFIGKGLTEDRQKALVEAMTGIGNSLDLTVVAEGVETHEQLTFMRSIHCPVIQGYYFSRPLPAENVPQWVQESLPALKNKL
ncbi:oxygen-sensing cyclic-di-GMP phosphodiesterase DosP [Trabulsiella odontotermitis]|uniref:oxygen-sensing cyclic-di-GMP phosphodiesterase DosP n=1 Tax=Trabulsiella odontotermitis TaxID=379893 RepID=UPI0006766FA5|nr:oxygen-sensing cyclic-di-GMP phosphodiesterase DosP [Trabulsiella odontotermitis]KNC91936.1 c-di-GMP phosphodiesterase [Trabulsiella odontotermitis]